MMNIPTDLLRTLIAVVDLRSFTKAAHSLGVTQPAVSAQIKRLQYLLGFELLDKSAPGVSLTPRGDVVIGHARRMLSINDSILELTTGRPAAETLRLGIPGDYAGQRLPATLARFRMKWPGIAFNVTGGAVDSMLRDLKQGDLDVVFALSTPEETEEARHRWVIKPVWVRSDATALDPEGPVPLVSYGDDCACQRLAVATLHRAGRDCNFVFTSRSHLSLVAAVAAGFGLMVMPRGRALMSKLTIWEDPPLPPLPDLYCGIFVRESGNEKAIEELADHLAADLWVDYTTLGNRVGRGAPVMRATGAV